MGEKKDPRIPYPFSHREILMDGNKNPIAIEYKEGGWYDSVNKVYIGGITVYKEYINNDVDGDVINLGNL